LCAQRLEFLGLGRTTESFAINKLKSLGNNVRPTTRKTTSASQAKAQGKKKPRDVRERNKLRTHNDIYQSAVELFNSRGYEDVTVNDICDQSGVSKATFFRYFGNKFGLVDEFNHRMATKIDAEVNLEHMSSTECIRIATDVIYDEWLHSAPQLRSLALEFVRTQTRISPKLYDPMARGLGRTLIRIIRKGQQRGEFSKHIQASLVAPMIIYAWTISTVAYWFDKTDKPRFKKSIHDLVELQIAGLIHR